MFLSFHWIQVWINFFISLSGVLLFFWAPFKFLLLSSQGWKNAFYILSKLFELFDKILDYSFKFCALGFNYIVLRIFYRTNQLNQRHTTLPIRLFLFCSLSLACELVCLVICLIWQSGLPYIVSLQELSDLSWPDKVLDKLFNWTWQRWLQNCRPEARLVGSEVARGGRKACLTSFRWFLHKAN